MLNLFTYFKKRKLKKLEFTLESCVSVGLLTREEFLRIKKDRATAQWRSEVAKESAKKRKSKAKEVIEELEEVEEEEETSPP